MAPRNKASQPRPPALAGIALREKPAFFEAQLHSVIEGILVVDAHGKKILQNKRFVELFGIPEELANSEDIEEQRTWAMGVVKNPRQFIERIEYLSAHPLEISRDELELRNGKVLDRYSAPVIGADGEYYGRIWTFHDITDCTRTKCALRESEVKFRQLAENITDVFWMSSPDLQTMHYVSPGYELTWGRTAQSLYSHPHQWIDAVLPEERDTVRAAFASLRENEPKVSVEYRIARPDGTVRWIHDRGFQVHDAAGNLIRLTGIATDITERKLAEIAAHRLAAIVESSDDAMIGKNLQGIVTSWNPAAERTFGYLASEMVGQPISRLIPPERQQEEVEILRELQSGKSVKHFETVRVRKDGTTLDVSITVSPVRDSAGVVIGASKVVQDITDRKQAEARLLLQSAALEAAANTLVLTDNKGAILWANRAFTALTGYSLEEAMGKTHSILKSGKHDQEFYDDILNTIYSGKVWNGEIINRRKDGTFYTEDMTITPMTNAQGEITNFISVKQDISARKALEAQFLRAQRMESIGTLAGGIAHDLNNGLAPITMAIEILRTEATSSQGRKMLALMEASAQHCSALVGQVLSFARGIEGKRVEVNPIHILNEIGNIIRDTFPKNIECIFDWKFGVWTVTGDPTHLHQVFTNLCVNARDAMPHGGKLTLSMQNTMLDDVYAGMNPDARPGAYVVIKVEDTGGGIPPGIREKIFEPFFTTKEIGKGTGLGLSTTMGIVKSHGGFIHVYSEMGKGSIFRVYLPANTATNPAEAAALKENPLPRGNGEMVLLVDDEERLRTVARTMLDQFGYRVLLAANGAEAIALYAQKRDQIDIVLTDMAMPVMDGPATIVALRALYPEVKIIASSGLKSEGGNTMAAGSGVRHFVSKPYTAETILTVLADALQEPA